MSGSPPSLSRRKRLAFGCSGLIIGWLLLEILVQVIWLVRFREFQILRDAMLGHTQSVARHLRATEQPYLCYVPAPGYANRLGVQHNEQGYRGRAVPMRRQPGLLRVLFLGGSTVYGWAVEDAAQAYPAQVERLLAANPPAGYRGVEVINGGLPQGTSAEMLTHYLFKFHYFRPDLVVIEAGGNDALAMVGPVYQPDYAHWRRQLHNVERLPAQSRWMMYSRVLATAIIVLFRYEYITPDSHTWPGGTVPPARWYPDLDERQGGRRPIPDEDLAIAHNLDTLVRQCQADGAKVLLVPFRSRAKSGQPEAMKAAFTRNEQIVQALAKRFAVPLAPFPESVVAEANWTDDCHLNAAGEEQKARHVEAHVRRALGAAP